MRRIILAIVSTAAALVFLLTFKTHSTRPVVTPPAAVGTPGFARAQKADGTVIADFSAGPGHREVKFSEVSFSHGAPVKITSFRFIAEGGWPEQPEYFDTRPRSGYPMPTA